MGWQENPHAYLMKQASVIHRSLSLNKVEFFVPDASLL